jgi:hypothetical protein
VNERYVVLATSSKPDLTAAVSGSFSGPSSINSSLDWCISVEEEGWHQASPEPQLQAA